MKKLLLFFTLALPLFANNIVTVDVTGAGSLGVHKDSLPNGVGFATSYQRLFWSKLWLGGNFKHLNMSHYPNVINFNLFNISAGYDLFSKGFYTLRAQVNTGLALVSIHNSQNNVTQGTGTYSITFDHYFQIGNAGGVVGTEMGFINPVYGYYSLHGGAFLKL